jgi:ADP-dependent NAD(P)H-hydrate dehydratase / NAD(P)H-hydrate epimerase
LKVLTAAEMREVDRRTEELGITGPILMENAGHRVVEFVAGRFTPLHNHHVVILCGKGNNGGDGYVIARQLHTRFRLRRLDVVAAFPDDKSAARQMAEAAGCAIAPEITPEMRHASLVIDAVLGTGVTGAARGRALDFIREINSNFPGAKVVAVDVPSGMNSDSGASEGEFARADATVTFTAPKLCHVLPPNCDATGELHVGHIGSPARLLDAIALHMTEPADFRDLLRRRDPDSNKGMYGHVLAAGGAPGKTGAAEMMGIAALRAGAGLVTVASAASGFANPELMMGELPNSWDALTQASDKKTIVAIGPGLGTGSEHIAMVRTAVERLELPMVLDADALNALAGHEWRGPAAPRVLTPHPGEMSRLAGISTREVQAGRIAVARQYAQAHNCTVVLKGYRTVTAFADGRAWINPTGTPALATGGTGDILTGLIAGTMAQSPRDWNAAVLAGVYLHGLAAQMAERVWGERAFIATDLLQYLPEAMRDSARLSDHL